MKKSLLPFIFLTLMLLPLRRAEAATITFTFDGTANPSPVLGGISIATPVLEPATLSLLGRDLASAAVRRFTQQHS